MDIILNILGGVATSIVIWVGMFMFRVYKFRKISSMEGIYYSFLNGQESPNSWIRLSVNNSVVDITGGRKLNDLSDVTIEGQIVFKSHDSTTGTGYYIDNFSNTEIPEYIGNGRYNIKRIDKNTIRVSADYFKNKTVNGQTMTVMIKQDIYWKRK